jgi:beta-aspartyl-peptidase (threonine type)
MVIVVHGGVAEKVREGSKEVIIKACEAGYTILKKGGSSLDAVEKSITILEDSPLFNAGIGGALNIEGEAELDATIMGERLKVGAVTCVIGVKNPISLARKVMEETDHVILAGSGAVNFAQHMGIPFHETVTDEARRTYNKLSKRIREGRKIAFFHHVRKFLPNTVGACAIDKYNRLAAGTSTGGLFMRMKGRVSDAGIVGAGTYVGEERAVSCTGHGEWMIKLCLAKSVCETMKEKGIQDAINWGVKLATEQGCEMCGIIGIDKEGEVGIGFNAPYMTWGYIKEEKLQCFT